VIIRYLDPLEKLEYEIIQRREEGNEIQAEALHHSWLKLQKKPDNQAREAADKILADLMKTDAKNANLSLTEPDDLAAIRRASQHNSPAPHKPHHLAETDLYDRLLGGWLGRAAGCLLGKPVERYMRPILREMLQSNDCWPLTDYWTQEGMPQDIMDRYPWKRRLGFESLRENITCMPEDDDLNYTMLNLHVVENYGPGFSSRDMATAWVTNLPAFQLFTAERVAYVNILNGHDAPESATFINPFREWIGAQIRADLWGYISPGDPAGAAEMAWRDARISHSRNGIYSEMFFAALIANAFTGQEARKLIEDALTHIPVNSRLAEAISLVLALPIDKMDWEGVLDELDRYFGRYHWVHSINNAALTVAALLAGDGDYQRTICYTVMGGWDTDSNGATAGSIIGIIQGAKALPEKWIAPLKDRVRSSLSGFDNAHFTDLASRTLNVIQRPISSKNDGSISQSDDF